MSHWRGGGRGRPTFGKFLQGHPETVGHGPDFVPPVKGPQGFHMWGDSSKGPFLKHLPIPAPPPPPHTPESRKAGKGEGGEIARPGFAGFNLFSAKNNLLIRARANLKTPLPNSSTLSQVPSLARLGAKLS